MTVREATPEELAIPIRQRPILSPETEAVFALLAEGKAAFLECALGDRSRRRATITQYARKHGVKVCSGLHPHGVLFRVKP